MAERGRMNDERGRQNLDCEGLDADPLSLSIALLIDRQGTFGWLEDLEKPVIDRNDYLSLSVPVKDL